MPLYTAVQTKDVGVVSHRMLIAQGFPGKFIHPVSGASNFLFSILLNANALNTAISNTKLGNTILKIFVFIILSLLNLQSIINGIINQTRCPY